MPASQGERVRLKVPSPGGEGQGEGEIYPFASSFIASAPYPVLLAYPLTPALSLKGEGVNCASALD